MTAMGSGAGGARELRVPAFELSGSGFWIRASALEDVPAEEAEMATQVTARRDELEIVSEVDQLPLCVHRWQTERPARGVVVVAHGVGEHALRYAELAQALVRAGLRVLAPDHRGHGRSLGPGGLGVPGSFASASEAWTALVSDLRQVVELARKDHADGGRVILFGHSMGSLLAQSLCTSRGAAIDALVLSGTTLIERAACADPGTDDAPIGGFHPGNMHELADLNFAFQPQKTPFDWLSRDPERVDAYIADPLCGFDAATSARIFGPEQLLELSDPRRLSRLRADLPVLLVAGSADPLNRRLGALRRLEQLWRQAGVRHIDRQYYANARHEMLNELNRAEVVREIVRWISDRCDAPRPDPQNFR